MDLKRTESEKAARTRRLRREEAADLDAEEKAERAAAPGDRAHSRQPGVYMVQGEQVTTLKQAEVKMVNNKRRSILKAMSPIPIVAGKSTVEMDGLKAALHAYSANVRNSTSGLRIGAAGDYPHEAWQRHSRIVQTLNIVPVFERDRRRYGYRRDVQTADCGRSV